jgi:flagellar motor switch protein FliN/FliY
MSSSPTSSSSSDPLAAEFARFTEVLCGVDIVLGTGTMSVRECLQLRRQAVVKLTQAAGADLHVHVNGVPVALGEVVIVDDSTAIRITEIVQPANTELHS